MWSEKTRCYLSYNYDLDGDQIDYFRVCAECLANDCQELRKRRGMPVNNNLSFIKEVVPELR